MGDSNDGNGQEKENDGNGQEKENDGPSTAEKVIMAVSVVVAVSLFAFAISQAVTGPTHAQPTVTVVDRTVTDDGDVVFGIELRNPQDVGLFAATVEATCTQPPTNVEFANIPADGRRTARVVCPPGTQRPGVSVASWRER